MESNDDKEDTQAGKAKEIVLLFKRMRTIDATPRQPP